MLLVHITDETCHAAVPVLQQAFHRSTCTAAIVVGDAGSVHIHLAIDQDHRHIGAPDQVTDPLLILITGDPHNALCPEGAGALKAAVLLLFGVVRDAQQDAVIVLAQIFFKACNHLGEEGICQIRHDQQHRAAFAALEAARHLIGHIVHFLRRSQDLFLGLGIHQRAVRKCP